jgi:hypothetical protein
LKNEVKRKMMIDSRKSPHQSHPERMSIAKVNQKIFSSHPRVSKFESLEAVEFCPHESGKEKIARTAIADTWRVRETH